MLYAAGSVAYVGGSLVPLGGHNVLEPASLGRPILTGPSLENFADVAEPLIVAGALTQVDSPTALAKALVRHFDDPVAAQRQGQAGYEVIKEQAGALTRTLDGLARLLPQPHSVSSD